MSGIAIRRCETCRQKLFVVEHDEIEPIGAARITKSDHRLGRTEVTCICGNVEAWEGRRPIPPVSMLR